MNKKKATPNNEAALKKTHSKSKVTDTSAAAQRATTLDLIRSSPKSTLQLRRDGDILAPAARILELRRRGFEIVTQWVQQATDCGTLHRVALYVLLRETGGQL